MLPPLSLGRGLPKRKFRNVKCELEGYKFDSKKERDYYAMLKLREKAGEVSGIAVHPSYAITINGIHICKVILDFEFTDSGKRRFIDCKGMDTAISRLKRRMVEAQYVIKVELA